MTAGDSNVRATPRCAVDVEDVLDGVLGIDDDAAAKKLAEHVVTCPACQDLVRDLDYELRPLGEWLVDHAATCPLPTTEEAERWFAGTEGAIDRVQANERERIGGLARRMLPEASAFAALREDDWSETTSDGVRVRLLDREEATGRTTVLMQFDEGAKYPAQDLTGVEEVFVIRGEVTIGAVSLRVGDYQRMDAGWRCPEKSSVGGCMIIVVGVSDVPIR